MKKIKLSRILLVVAGFLFLILGYRNRIKNNFQRFPSEETDRNSMVVSSELDNKKNPQLTEVDKVNNKPLFQNKDRGSDEKDQLGDIYIHITGAVAKEGLYKLKEGARLDDLVKVCGGLKEDADISKINLSMILEDQMRIHILKVGEMMESDIDPCRNISNPSPTIGQSGGSKKDRSGKINLNKASLEELMTLKGIGEKKAQAIIEYREKVKFKSPKDLLEISGIGEKILENIIDQVSVE